MKAVLSVVPGGPHSVRIEEVPEPHPGPGQVRVAVRACGVNYPDLLFIADRYQVRPPRPFSPGGEVAGYVDAVGPDVTTVSLGDRVLAVTGWGGMAEKVVVRADRVTGVPGNVPFDAAATLMFTYGTAWHALRDRAGLQPGSTLLVLGAAGGVGTAAVQVGQQLGARVVAGASSTEKADVARRAGAADVVVYPQGPLDADAARALSRQFGAAVGPRGADVVLDPVGGDYTEPALRALGTGGRYLVVGFTAGIPRLPLNLVLLKAVDVHGVDWRGFLEQSPQLHAREAAELVELCASGGVEPVIGHRFPFEEAATALSVLEDRRAAGKIVICVGE